MEAVREERYAAEPWLLASQSPKPPFEMGREACSHWESVRGEPRMPSRAALTAHSVFC